MALLKKLGNLFLSCIVAVVIMGAVLLAPFLVTLATILGGFSLIVFVVYFILVESDNQDNEDN